MGTRRLGCNAHPGRWIRPAAGSLGTSSTSSIPRSTVRREHPNTSATYRMPPCLICRTSNAANRHWSFSDRVANKNTCSVPSPHPIGYQTEMTSLVSGKNSIIPFNDGLFTRNQQFKRQQFLGRCQGPYSNFRHAPCDDILIADREQRDERLRHVSSRTAEARSTRVIPQR